MLQQILLAPVEVVGVDTQRHTRHRPPKRVTKVFLKTQQVLFEHAGRLCYVNSRCMTRLPRGLPDGPVGHFKCICKGFRVPMELQARAQYTLEVALRKGCIILPRVLKRCNLLLDVDSQSAVESNDSSHFGWVTKGCFRVFKEGEYYGFLAFTP